MDQELDVVFYDADCALCHTTVRFLHRRDPAGDLFAFAPLGGTTYQETLTPEEIERLPDSVVVRTVAGRVLARSAAVVYLLERVGGRWTMAAGLLASLPTSASDAGYSAVASLRRALWGRPDSACPVPAESARHRFLD